jgi:hypothetical protein
VLIPEIITDSTFPQLATAVDPQQMQRILQAHLPGCADGTRRITQLKIRRFQHQPHRRCEICYSLVVEDRARAESREELLYALLTDQQTGDPANQPAHRPQTSAMTAGDGFLPPVYYLAPLRMALWCFPHDPALPNLAKLFDLAHFQRLLAAPTQQGTALAGEANKLQRIETQIVKYVPATRCVATHTFWDNATGSGAPRLRLFSKVYDQGRGAAIFTIMQALWATPARQSNGLPMPEPLAYDPLLGAILTPALDGAEALDHYRHEPNGTVMTQAGHLLAALHQSTLPNLPRLPITALPATLPAVVALLADADGAESHRLAQLCQTLQTSFDTLPALPTVPLHTAFRINQMRVINGGLTLFDFDGVRAGNPLEDVGSFVAHLHYLQIKGTLPAALTDAAIADFCRAYAERVPWPVPKVAFHWYVAALLVSKHIKKTIKRGKTDSHRQQTALLTIAEALLVDRGFGSSRIGSLEQGEPTDE